MKTYKELTLIPPFTDPCYCRRRDEGDQCSSEHAEFSYWVHYDDKGSKHFSRCFNHLPRALKAQAALLRVAR